MSFAAATFAGILFGLGLAVSGMSEPDNVLAFLTLDSNWSATLLFVMGSAVAVTAVGYALVQRRHAPLWQDTFHLPMASKIDAPLIGGSALFGLGWALAGYCPGPAIVGAFLLDSRALAFLVAFLLGLVAVELARALRPPDPASATG